MSSPFKLLLMDYDETFKATEQPWKAYWSAECAEFGVPFNDEIYSDINANNQLLGEYLADWIGAPYSKFDDLERQIRSEIKKLPLNDGAMELVERSKTQGALVYLWTHSPEKWVFDTGEKRDLNILDGFVFDAQKPAPHSVFQAAKKAGCQLHEIVGVDNSASGVRPLKSAGAYAIHYRVDGQPHLDIKGVHTVSSHRDIDLCNLPSLNRAPSLEASR